MKRDISDIDYFKGKHKASNHKIRTVETEYIDCKEHGIVTIVTDIDHRGLEYKEEKYCTGNDKAIAWLNGDEE